MDSKPTDRMTTKTALIAALVSILSTGYTLHAEDQVVDEQLVKACMIYALDSAHDTTTIAELRANCIKQLTMPEVEEPDGTEKQALSDLLATPEKKGKGVISKRMEAEDSTTFNPYVITPHKMNYILPISVTDNLNTERYEFTDNWADNITDSEAKFQFSFKVPLNIKDLFVKNDKLFFGFTLQSWWQVYSENISKPFRETNYQPELFYSTPLDVSWGSTNSAFQLGIEHQSNGRALPLSRSWNRIYLNWLFEYDNFALSFKPWYRLPEDDKVNQLDPEGDDNPDIHKFMGYFELGLAYQWDEYEFHFKGRQNFNTSRGGVEMGVTFPLTGRLRGYAQYFGGYGESLIDYNHSQHRFGIGIALTDLL
jgi:phospholipase A1